LIKYGYKEILKRFFPYGECKQSNYDGKVVHQGNDVKKHSGQGNDQSCDGSEKGFQSSDAFISFGIVEEFRFVV